MIDICIAVILDLIIGDPYNFPHPVKLMGKIINLEDRVFRDRFRDKRKLRIIGLLIVLFNIVISFSLIKAILNLLSPYKLIKRVVNIYLMYTCLSLKALKVEALKVYDSIELGLEKARYQLSFIVGRDTSNLAIDEIIKATVETVAENTSDGIIAPLFYIILLGGPGGIMYKMVNTMDSMLGYKNERYIDFGRYAAIIDDIYNYIPARITGFVMGIVGLILNRNKDGFKVMIRDRKKHASPNAGYPEAAVAGILGIQLGGDNIYHGKLVEKPTIGDNINKVERKNIIDTIKIMYMTELVFLIIYLIIYSI